MAKLASITEKLERAQTAFLAAASLVPDEVWTTAPKPGAWSAAEIVAHVMGVETTVIAGAQRILRNEPKPVPLLKRFSLPPAIVERRIIRIKSPVPINANLLASKEMMLADLTGVRAQTLNLMESTETRELHAYRWKHPVLGMLNAYGWFSFLGSHQIRHTTQMQEVAETLRKAVAGLQK